MSIGSRIMEARVNLDLTQEALAKKVGVTKSAIANYENGVSAPRLETMFRLFEVLKCDANYFYQDDCPRLSESQSEISEAERKMILAYRAADDRAREDALKTLLDHPRKQL